MTIYIYNPILKCNKEIVSRSASAMYLGHMLHTVNTSKELIEHSVKEFKKINYGFISRFDSVYVTTKNKFFQQYCGSMYGSQLWDMTNPKIDVMYTQRWKAYRQVLEVPYMTHCDLLPLINDNMPLDCLLDWKYISFLKSILNSENNVVNFTAKYKLFDQTSTLGKNITHLLHKYNIPVEDLTLLPKQRVKYIFMING